MSMFDRVTVRDCYQKHQELWKWLSENPGKGKIEWPGWMEFEDFDMEIVEEINECFGCLVKDTMGTGCTNCIIAWPNGRGCGWDDKSPFYKWARMEDEDFDCEEVRNKASKLAKEISELPLNSYWEDKMDWVIGIQEN